MCSSGCWWGAALWGRLAELIDARLVAAPSDQGPPLDDTRSWLSHVRISGFRGVADDAFVLDVEPRPGLTSSTPRTAR